MAVAKIKRIDEYEEAKIQIAEHLEKVTDDFVAIGYYLKHVKEKELYINEYADIWEFADQEFAISKSKASRYISICERFTVGGNSMDLEDQYKGYGYSALQEMLTMEPEQLEKVYPGMTVKQLRDLRRPVLKSVATSQQPENKTKPTSRKYTAEECNEMIRKYMSGEYGSECEKLVQEHGDSKFKLMEEVKKEFRARSVFTIRKGTQGEFCDDGVWIRTGLRADSFKYLTSWYVVAGLLLEEFPHAVPDNRKLMDQTEDDQQEEGMKGDNLVTPEENTAIIKEIAEQIVEKYYSEVSEAVRISREESTLEDMIICLGYELPRLCRNTDITLVNSAKHPDINRIYFQAAYIVIHFESSEDDVKIVPYRDIAEYILRTFEERVEDSADDQNEEFVTELYAVDEGQDISNEEETDLESVTGSYTVAEQIEGGTEEMFFRGTDLEPEGSDIKILKDMVKRQKRLLQDWNDIKNKSDSEKKMVKKEKLKLDALEYYLNVMESREPDKPDQAEEQPELNVLKNNNERKEWLAEYKNWQIWIDNNETGERYYRYILGEKSIVVKVYFATAGRYDYDLKEHKQETGWFYEEYYLVEAGQHFKDCLTNQTQIINFLKEYQKKQTI